MSTKNVIPKTYTGIIKFKPSNDSIKESSYVTDGCNNGYVSNFIGDGTICVNWLKENTVEIVKLEHVKAIRPYFQHEKVHGEINRNSYAMLFYLLDNNIPITTKPIEFRNRCTIGDTCSIIDYKFLYDNNKHFTHTEVFTISKIEDYGIVLDDKLAIKRSQIQLISKQDKYTLFEVVCPICNN